MCGKNCKNFDCMDSMIIMFEVKRISFYLVQQGQQPLTPPKVRFLYYAWLFFLHLQLLSCKLHTCQISKVKEEFCKSCLSCQKSSGQQNFWSGHPIRKKIKFRLRGYMFTPCVKIVWTPYQNWLHRNLSKFSIICSTDNCPLGVNLTRVLTTLEMWIPKRQARNNGSPSIFSFQFLGTTLTSSP